MLCRYLLAYMAMCVNVLQAAVAGTWGNNNQSSEDNRG